jgi:putative PIN family toxin of toxin-antitoxin system
MRVLLDTNVLAAGMVGAERASSSPPAQIWRLSQSQRFDLLVSEQILAELDRTFDDPWFADRIDAPGRERLIRDLLKSAELVEVTVVVSGVASHPADDQVLAAAVSGNARFLVTGDAGFLRVGTYRGVTVCTPAAFLLELDLDLERGSKED